MKVKGNRTETVEIELTRHDIQKIIRTRLEEIYPSWKSNYYILNGVVCYDIEHRTSHTWTSTTQLRSATPEDKFINDLYTKLRQ